MQGGWTSTSRRRRRLSFDKTAPGGSAADDGELPRPITLTRNERSDFTDGASPLDLASAPGLLRQRSADVDLARKATADDFGTRGGASGGKGGGSSRCGNDASGAVHSDTIAGGQGESEKLYAKAFASYGAVPPTIAELDLKPFAAPCAVCSKQSPYRCNQCHAKFYCSREHQRAHWPEHQYECKPCDKPFVWKPLPPKQDKSTTASRSDASSWMYPGTSNSISVKRNDESSSSTDADSEAVMSEYQSAINTDRAMGCGYENHMDADQCPCCYEDYQRNGPNTHLVPRKLPCTHVSCTGCLDRMFSYSAVKCPICLKSHKVASVQEVEVYTTHVLDTINEAGGGGAYELTDMNSGVSSARAGGDSAPGDDEKEVTYSGDNLIALVSMGFDEATAQTALRAANGDVERAVDYCFDPSSIQKSPPESTLHRPHSGGSTSTAQGYEADTADGDDDEWSNSAAVAPAAETHANAKRILSSSGRDGGGGNEVGDGGGKRTKASFQSSDLTTLVGLGFDDQLAADALKRSGWNLEEALMKLTAGPGIDNDGPYADCEGGVVTYPPGGKLSKEVTFGHTDAHTNNGGRPDVKSIPAHATSNPLLSGEPPLVGVGHSTQAREHHVETTREFDPIFQALQNQDLSKKEMAKETVHSAR
mmetsp:Transcript_91482/g.261329  ORF Transcript_91482/g.261329 Transcript_91482/m.261329 type:complete len:649 (+) Transcript_91482:540-2486(+)